MKNIFYPVLIMFSFFLLYANSTNAQELVIPEKKAAVKMQPKTNAPAENNSSETSSTSNSENVTLTKSQVEQGSSVNTTGNKPSANIANATQDSDDYQIKKADWIKNNPEKYKSISGNPNIVFITETDFNALPADQQQIILNDEANYIILR